MKILKLFILLFPLISISQVNLYTLWKKLNQNNKYEYVYAFENNYAVFRTFDNKMGVIDSLEKVIIKPVFSFIHNKKGLENLFEVGNKINKKFKRGFIDINGKTKVPIIYDDVFYEEKGLIKVSKDNKFGVLDTLNNIILPLKFDYISFDNDLIIAKIKKKNYLYNFKGNKISNLQFSEISNFTNQRALVTFQNKTNAIIDRKANFVLKPIKGFSFDQVLNDDLFLIKDKLSSKKGIINTKGEFIIKCKYDEIKKVNSLFIAKSNNKKGLISLTDSIIKPFIYDEIYFSFVDDAVSFKDNNLRDNFIVKKDKLYGVINPNFQNDIIPLLYKNIRTLFNKYFIVENTENKNGLYIENGEKVLNEDYKFYNVFENSIFATKNKKQFLINLEKVRYNEIEVFVDEFVKFKDEPEFSKNVNQIFKSKGKFGVINYENHIIIPCEYELIENIYLSKEFIVKKNNKFGIVNSENIVIVEIDYDEFKKLKEVIQFSKEKQILKKYHEITYR